MAKDSKQQGGSQARPWLPPREVIVTETTVTLPTGVTAAGDTTAPTYTIIRTTEVDEYDEPISAADVKTPAPPGGDTYQGTARKAAKLSIATAAVETLPSVKHIVASLVPDAAMEHHHPPISAGPLSQRVAEEMRNVRCRAYLFAASLEADNDFHLIIGTDPKAGKMTMMTMELSGLPPASSAAYKTLKAARDTYKSFFGAHLPGLSYDFYDPPIQVDIQGSLFFDVTHATGPKPGPPTLRPYLPTIWEVHPISRIVLGS